MNGWRRFFGLAVALGSLSVLTACPFISQADWDARVDADGDGLIGRRWGGEDCDDSDPLVGAVTGTSGEIDCDGDSFSFAGGDCDDSNPAIHPGATEQWYDGVDQDCAGDSDYDRDGDGHDADSFGGDDCDDSDPEVHSGANDLPLGADQNCDGIP